MITIVPIIASNKISEVIISKINRLVYKILPILVICEVSTKKVSQDLLFTLAILTRLLSLIKSSDTILLMFKSKITKIVLYKIITT